jgi:hypothetical protein
MRGVLIYCLILIAFSVSAQNQTEIRIETSAKVMEVGDNFSIKVIILNSQNSDVADFPEIKGFRKEGRSVSHANVKSGRKTVLQHIVTQNYEAIKWGTFDIPNYIFKVNGANFELETDEITISNGNETVKVQYADTLDNEDALLFLFVDKAQIRVGEGFRIHLAFYVSEKNTAPWEFPKNLDYQINQMTRILKPENCLENKRDIRKIEPEPAVINGKKYIRYKFFESIYYPLNNKTIELPSVRLDMDKKVDSTSKAIVMPFFSRPFKINVSSLPEHPLKNRVSVGVFSLAELTKIGSVKTGKIINYVIKITGQGNTKTMLFDKPVNDSSFDFYPAQTTDNQPGGSIDGAKTFAFKVFPKDSGSFDFNDYFKWIYFNTAKGDYDTLKVSQKLRVTGPKITTSSEKGIYYDLEHKSIAGREVNYRNIIKMTVNVLLFLMLVGMLFIFDFRRKQRQQ